MTKLEELELLNKEVLEAQTKLSDIMTAINREKLVEEKFVKTNKELTEKVEKINADFLGLEERYAKLSVSFEQKHTECARTISVLEERFTDKIQILKELEQLIVQKEDEASLSKKRFEDDLNTAVVTGEKTQGILTAKIDVLNTDISNKENQLAVLLKQITLADVTIVNLETQKKQIEDGVQKLQEVAFKETIAADDNLTKINDSIKEKTEELYVINGNVVEAQDLIKDLSEKITIATKELEEILKEKNDFVKEKLDLARAREELQQKEEAIRYRYEQAGVKF